MTPTTRPRPWRGGAAAPRRAVRAPGPSSSSAAATGRLSPRKQEEETERGWYHSSRTLSCSGVSTFARASFHSSVDLRSRPAPADTPRSASPRARGPQHESPAAQRRRREPDQPGEPQALAGRSGECRARCSRERRAAGRFHCTAEHASESLGASRQRQECSASTSENAFRPAVGTSFAARRCGHGHGEAACKRMTSSLRQQAHKSIARFPTLNGKGRTSAPGSRR